MEYQKYLTTEDWKHKREQKLTRNRRCGICAAGIIDIHHLNYKNLVDVQMSDLRKLCRRCHFLAHRLYKEGKIIFRSTNHQSRWAILKSAVKKELGITKLNMFAPS